MGLFNLLTEARIREWQQRKPVTSSAKLETQLMVLLEQAGRPLAARQLAETINAHRLQL